MLILHNLETLSQRPKLPKTQSNIVMFWLNLESLGAKLSKTCDKIATFRLSIKSLKTQTVENLL